MILCASDSHNLYAIYLCSRDALGIKVRPSERATIGYLVYKAITKIKMFPFF